MAKVRMGLNNERGTTGVATRNQFKDTLIQATIFIEIVDIPRYLMALARPIIQSDEDRHR